MRLSVAVLAGGESTRMGQDKARLPVRDVPLIARVVHAVDQLQPSEGITIVGGGADLTDLIELAPESLTTAYRGVRHIPDAFPGEGPLGGIITALQLQRSRVLSSGANVEAHLLTVACDLPDLHVPALRHLVSESHATDADIGIPLANGRRQWHVAVWNQRCLPQLEESFASGTRSIWKAAAPLRQTVIISSQVAGITDLDTPTDVADFVGKNP